MPYFISWLCAFSFFASECDMAPQIQIACEDRGETTIACPNHYSTIHILDANFGRTRPESEVCPYGK